MPSVRSNLFENSGNIPSLPPNRNSQAVLEFSAWCFPGRSCLALPTHHSTENTEAPVFNRSAHSTAPTTPQSPAAEFSSTPACASAHTPPHAQLYPANAHSTGSPHHSLLMAAHPHPAFSPNTPADKPRSPTDAKTLPMAPIAAAD